MGGDRDQNHIEQSYIIVCLLKELAFSEKNMGHQKQNLTYIVPQELISVNNDYRK